MTAALRIAALAAAAAGCLYPQTDAERAGLRQALSEAGNSQVDFIRAIEGHLQKYPQTAQRAELERALVKTALEVGDSRRVLLYGERVLSQDSENIELLERISRLLLDDDGNKENAQRALGYSTRLEKLVRALPDPKPGDRGAARQYEERQILIGRSLAYQARAVGNLGRIADAEGKARLSFEAAPSAESAREVARWLDRQGKTAEAIPHLANALALSEPVDASGSRAKDLARLAEWRGRTKLSEEMAGAELLRAFDRVSRLIDERKARLRALEPNSQAAGALDYTISGLSGEKLPLASMKGKVIVFDFWATWCGPCRAQQPLYEQVKERHKDNADVVFLNVSTDEDRSRVKPFLAENRWNKTVYFDDGLAGLLRISSIPTTVVFNRRGEVSSRMNGYIAEKFVDMLDERIRQALGER